MKSLEGGGLKIAPPPPGRGLNGFLIKFVFVRVGMLLIVMYPTIHNLVAAFLIFNKERMKAVFLFYFWKSSVNIFSLLSMSKHSIDMFIQIHYLS